MTRATERHEAPAAGPAPGRTSFTAYMSCIAVLVACRAPNLVMRHKITDPGTAEEFLPPELRDAAPVRDGRWKAVMDGTRRATIELYHRMKTHYDGTEYRRPNSNDTQWSHHLNILARQSVEMLTPTCHAPIVDVRCHGKPATAWSTLYNHELTEVRDFARQLGSLPTDEADGHYDRRHGGVPARIPPRERTTDRREPDDRLAAAAARLGDPHGGQANGPPAAPAVQLVDYDDAMDLRVAAAAAYEHGDLEYGTTLRRMKQELTREDIARVVEQAARERRWSEQPPARALGMMRMTFEVTASAMSWMALGHMATRAGATVLMQPVGVPEGHVAAPDAVRDAGAEADWSRTMETHDRLRAELAADGADAVRTQYALTWGHLCRGLISGSGDRLIRIIDWMLLQRGSAPYNAEIIKLGKHMYNHWTAVGGTTRTAVLQPRGAAGEPA